ARPAETGGGRERGAPPWPAAPHERAPRPAAAAEQHHDPPPTGRRSGGWPELRRGHAAHRARHRRSVAPGGRAQSAARPGRGGAALLRAVPGPGPGRRGGRPRPWRGRRTSHPTELMGVAEVFPREAASNPEAFTGERLTSALAGQAQIEHYHRYLFTRELCAGLDVLDVASGEGYGSAQIAQVARSVIGLEYSASTVHSAMANFPRGNLRFLQGDARAMPLPSRSFDVVVSFETIEHFDRQEEFLAEVHRVLRPGGRFVVSTPDRDIYSAPGMTPNPFHVKEMSRDEFVTLLLSTFRHVRSHLQRPVIGSVIVGEHPGGL